jgi:hypothetical protein
MSYLRSSISLSVVSISNTIETRINAIINTPYLIKK